MRVLFVCTGNTCRSPMAEGILKDIAREKNLNIEVESAGIFAMDGDTAAENAISALRQYLIDISDHKSQRISRDLVDDADLILVMSKSHRDSLVMNFPHIEDKVFLLNKYAFNEDRDIIDPYGGDLAIYEKTRDEILKALRQIKW